MPEPIRLRICPACDTGVPEEAARCPECGASLPPMEGAGDAGPDAVADAMGALFGGDGAARRQAAAPFVRAFLGRHLGCLGTTLLVVFGVPVLVGALAGNALAGLGAVLLAVGVAGLALTAWLVWLVWPARRRP